MAGRSASKCCFGNGHSDAMLTQLNEFRKNRQFTDVVLSCADISIAAHKNVLAAASPYFMAMFSGHFPESAQYEIQLNEIDAECLQLTIDFIYTGHLEVSETCVQLLLETATFLQLEQVGDLCAEYMIKNLMDADNCLGFRHFAEKQNNFMLLEAAKDFIITHFQDVVQSEEFYEMSFAELATILSHDDLFVHSDDSVLCGLVRWANQKPSERTSQIGSLLRYIHPACVSAEVARAQPLLQQESAGAQQWLDAVLQCCIDGGAQWRIFLLDKMGRQPELQRFDLGHMGEEDEEDQKKEQDEQEHEESLTAIVSLKPLPRPAFAVSLAAYKNILYVQGGSVGRSTRESFYYNVYRDQWYDLHPLLLERSHHRSLVLGESLYALGGNSLQGATSTVECLNLVTDKVTLRENMLAKRSSMGAVVCEQALYVMGGETDHRSLYSVERFDPREGLWQELPSLREVNSYCSSAAIVSTQQIYCCEGLGSCMERFDIRANKWEIIDFWEKREFYEIFAVDSQLFSVSGEALSRYNVSANRWLRVHKFPESREWDTAVGLQMMNYSN